jgi:hypothetical protein
MLYKTILFAAITVLLYIFLSRFALTPPKPREPTVPTPIAIIPLCENEDSAIFLTAANETVCKAETALYLRRNGKKITLKKVDSTDAYFTSSKNLVIFQSDNELIIEKLEADNTVKNLYTLPLKKGILPLSIILYSDDENRITVYVSAQKEAHTVTDTKSVFFRISLTLTDNSLSKVTSIEQRNMLRTVSLYNGGTLLLLREMFPFLQGRQMYLEWKERPNFMPVQCKNRPISYQSGNTLFDSNNCSKTPQYFLKTSAGYLTVDSENHSLLWNSAESSAPVIVTSNVFPENWHLPAEYTTRIGKRVYNCFDFSESLQITLRTCIQQL